MLASYKGVMWVSPENIDGRFVSLTTTRFSGCSKGDYGSLNLGYFTDDPVRYDNYLLVNNILSDITIKSPCNRGGKHNTVQNSNGKIAVLKQIHSSIVVEKYNFDDKIEEGDGFFTNTPGLFTGIQTADCFNVQLMGSNYAANLHCGWKSIYLGIIENALELFDKKNDRVLYAVIGPGICEQCYEVGEELIEKFVAKGFSSHYITCKDRYFLSLRSIIKEKLIGYGSPVVEDLLYCSFCKSYLYSYRRDKGTTGRMLSILGIRDER